MKIFSSLFVMIMLGSSAWAGEPGAPGPEMSAGLVAMTLAAGVVYVIKRRQRN